MELSLHNKEMREEAVRDVLGSTPGIEKDHIEFIKAVGKKFLEKQVARFPEICEIARVQNILAWKDMERYGKKGKYTESYGWSEDGTFKFEYQIPNDLYLFMVNVVYREFWNGKIWRKFMKMVCDGEDAYECLAFAKSYYGHGVYNIEKGQSFGADDRQIGISPN